MFGRKNIFVIVMTAFVGLHADQPVYLNPEVSLESSKPPVSLNIAYESERPYKINKTYQKAIQLAKNKFIAEKDNQDPATKQALFQVWADSKVDVNVRGAAWQAMNQVNSRNRERFESSTQEEYKKLLNANKGLAEYSVELTLKPKLYINQFGVRLTNLDTFPIIYEKAKGVKIKNNLLDGTPVVHILPIVLPIDGKPSPKISYTIYSKSDSESDSTLEGKPINGYKLLPIKMENDFLLFPFPEKLNSGVFLLRIQNDYYQIYLSPQDKTDQAVVLPEIENLFLSGIKSKEDDFPRIKFTVNNRVLSGSELEERIAQHKTQHPELFEPAVPRTLEQLPASVGFIEYTFDKTGKITNVDFKNRTNDGPPKILLVSERDSIELCKKELIENSIAVGPFFDFENGVTFKKSSTPQALIYAKSSIKKYSKREVLKPSVKPTLIKRTPIVINKFDRSEPFIPSGRASIIVDAMVEIDSNGKCSNIILNKPITGVPKEDEFPILKGLRLQLSNYFTPARQNDLPVKTKLKVILTGTAGKVMGNFGQYGDYINSVSFVVTSVD